MLKAITIAVTIIALAGLSLLGVASVLYIVDSPTTERMAGIGALWGGGGIMAVGICAACKSW